MPTKSNASTATTSKKGKKIANVQKRNTKSDSGPPLTPESLEEFVRTTVSNVKLLNQLAIEHPEEFRPLVRRMPAWPVMHSKRGSDFDFREARLSELQFSEDYPVDTSSNTRSRPNSPAGWHLTRWVECVYCYRLNAGANKECAWLEANGYNPFCGFFKDAAAKPSSELRRILKRILKFPPLTKDTSEQWADEVFIPLMMLLDAGNDEASCGDPVLKRIWRQKGVKSRATFKSRLLSKVRPTLRSLVKQ